MSAVRPQVLVVSASPAVKSRSRTLAKQALMALTDAGIEGRWLDLAEYDLRLFPQSERDPTTAWMREEFEGADGFVLACPVYNLSAGSAIVNFLHYVIESKGARPFRPFLILGGAGSPRSQLTLDIVARSMLHELRAIQIGPSLIGAGTEVDPDSGTVAPWLAARVKEATEALAVHAIVAATQVPQAVQGAGR